MELLDRVSDDFRGSGLSGYLESEFELYTV